ncbi:hypothetical protein ACSTHL_23310, partial [Vibrio parahaemolyticus]
CTSAMPWYVQYLFYSVHFFIPMENREKNNRVLSMILESGTKGGAEVRPPFRESGGTCSLGAAGDGL